MSIEHEWDEEGHCTIEVTDDTPAYQLKGRDIFGILLSMVAGYFGVTGQALQGLAREFFASAEFSRREYNARREEFEAEQARAEMAGALEGIVYFDGDGQAIGQ